VTAPRPALQVMGVIALSAALLGAAVQLQAVREAQYPPSPISEEDSLYLTSGKTLRRLTVTMNALVADLYWIRAIQYYGGAHRRLLQTSQVAPPPPSIAWSSDYEQLYPLLDLTTSVDPRFNMAYRFGSVFLGETYPTGAGRPDLAIKLLQKGLQAQPDRWQYMLDIGFVYYWYRNDYRSAATWFKQAASVPGSPWWLKSLAANTLASGGDRQSSRIMWEAIHQSADNDWLRKDAERRLAQLRALDQMDALEEAIVVFTRRTGQRPIGWNDLVRASLLRGLPRDPTGTPYELTEDGHVRLPPSSALWPLPVEPVRQTVPRS
jgi:tetratricopeptide (TPR) repeat protein